MGLFDWFKKTSAPTKAAPPASTAPPPGPGVIEAFDLANATGTVRLDDGTSLRFGRSACKGFEPVAGARVRVGDVGPHPLGGHRALDIDLDPNSEVYDALLAERDDAAGLAPTRADADASAAQLLGWITVLLREPIELGPQAAMRSLEPYALERHGVRASTEAGLSFFADGVEVRAHVGANPYPRDGLDLPEGFDVGRGFVSLSVGLPGMEALSREAFGVKAPFAEGGTMRAITRVAAALARRGRGVVLERAGRWVLDADDFVRRAGDLDDMECVPFGAWVECAIDREAKRYESYGMDVFGLPDVTVPVEGSDLWSEQRALEALLWACAVTVREDRPLREGEAVMVPVRAAVGAYELPEVEGAVYGYTVEKGDGVDALTCVEAPDLDDDEDLPLNLYQAMLDEALGERFPGDVVSEECAVIDPPHYLQTRRGEGRRVWVFTNGLGHRAQPGAEDEAPEYVEVMTALPFTSVEAARMVGGIGATIFDRGDDAAPFKVYDRVASASPELRIGGYVLIDGGDLTLRSGREVKLLGVAPVKQEVLARMRDIGSEHHVDTELAGEDRWVKVAASWGLASA